METQSVVKETTTPAAEEIEKLVIDPVHSSIGFSVRHMVISNVRGRFTRFSGAISYNRLDVARSSVAVSIDTASVNTGNFDRDDDLRGPNFLDAGQCPQMVFRSKRIEQQCDGYTCVGDLTMHGVTKEIAIPVEITGRQTDLQGKDRIGFEGELTLDRREFGLTYNALLANGGPVVGNEVKIQLSIEAVRE
jgi:polyisoprenoid-binding protein YceI